MSAALFVAVVMTAAIGCGGSAADTSHFVGMWTWDTGVINADCGALSVPPQDLTGQTLTLVKGGGGEVVATLTATCQITFTVSGDTATANPGQMCKLMVGTTNQTLAISSWTLTTADGASMMADMKGTALAGACTVTGNGMLSKQAAAP